jgi:hypothetical protein
MASLSCTTKSVKLLSGESFILPPGAKLIGATNPSLLTAKDDCISTENLEELQCYVCPIPIAAEEGDKTQYWEAVNQTPKLVGYTLNDTYTAFSTGPFPANDPGTFGGSQTAILAEMLNIPGIISADWFLNADWDRGSLNYFLINTVPSVANNLELVVSVSIPATFSGTTTAKGYFKFIPYSTMVSEGSTNLPTCTLT